MANIYPKTRHTQGTTYSRAGVYKLPAGTWSVTATVKTATGTVVEALSCNLSAFALPDVNGNTHALSIVSDATETALWPLAALLQDVIFTDASLVPVKVPAITTQILVSLHTPPTCETDNPLQVITPDMAPVLRGADGIGGAEAAEWLAEVELAKTDAETAAGTATTQAGIATTQAGNAATSAGTATTQAGIATTQAGLATSNGAAQVSLAAAQVSLAADQAAAAAASALTAAGHEDQTALDAIATAADRVQTGLDAASASASAGTATSQAGIATTQAGNASGSASAAAASFDSFDDRYLGAKAVAPTLDNDGAALLTGALYWDTALAALRVWTGAAWTNTTELDDRVLADQQLLGGVAYATDITGQLYNEIYNTDAVQGRPLPYVLETILLHINLLFDLAGAAGKWPLDFAETEKVMQALAGACASALDIGAQAARQVNGGSVNLEDGTATQPSLWRAGDRDTGLMFPAADTMAVVTAGLERLRVDANGYLGIGTNSPTGLLDVNGDKLRVRTAKTPASATAAGNAGEVCWDASYLYIATGTNQWKRAAIATW